jgi:hypothetical protein
MSVAVWRQHDAMRRCGNGFGVIPRPSDGEKEIDFRLIAAASINCDFRPRPKALSSEMDASSRQQARQNKKIERRLIPSDQVR